MCVLTSCRQLIEKYEGELFSYTLLHRIITRVETIKYALQYKTLPNSAKMAVRHMEFRHEYPHLFEEVPLSKTGDHICKRRFEQWPKFCRAHTDKITARNRLVDLYCSVSWCYSLKENKGGLLLIRN